MIGTSKPEYIFIRVCIVALQAIAPLSLGYLALSLYYGRFLLEKWLGWYTVVEAAFYLFAYLPRQRRMQEVRGL